MYEPTEKGQHSWCTHVVKALMYGAKMIVDTLHAQPTCNGWRCSSLLSQSWQQCAWNSSLWPIEASLSWSWTPRRHLPPTQSTLHLHTYMCVSTRCRLKFGHVFKQQASMNSPSEHWPSEQLQHLLIPAEHQHGLSWLYRPMYTAESV